MSWLRPTAIRTARHDLILGVNVNVNVHVIVDVIVDVDECSLPYRHIRLSMDTIRTNSRFP
jgi:hypothetical protein